MVLEKLTLAQIRNNMWNLDNLLSKSGIYFLTINLNFRGKQIWFWVAIVWCYPVKTIAILFLVILISTLYYLHSSTTSTTWKSFATTQTFLESSVTTDYFKSTLRCLIKGYIRLFNFRNFDTQCNKWKLFLSSPLFFRHVINEKIRQIVCVVTCSWHGFTNFYSTNHQTFVWTFLLCFSWR